jgi:hypothetical protein
MNPKTFVLFLKEGNEMALSKKEGGNTMDANVTNAGTEVDASKTSVEVFAKGGRTIRANYDKDEQALEGSMSDTLSFVHAIGNPKNPDAIHNSYKVVGYTLKSTKPISVPTVKLSDKKYLKFKKVEPRQVAANQEFHVNNIELGLLLSQREYAGQITGGDLKVALSATCPKAKDNERKGTAAEYIPNLKVLGGEKGKSIKDGLVTCGDKSGETEGGVATYQVKPGYEAFEIFLMGRIGTEGPNKIPRERGEQSKNLAAAFAQLYADKMEQ